MILKLTLSKNTKIVPFNYAILIRGKRQGWLGNQDRNKISLFTFSNILGGISTPNGYNFPNGGEIYFGYHDKTDIINIILAIVKNNNFICGMKIINFIPVNYNSITTDDFICLSPIHLAKKSIGWNSKNIPVTYKHPDSNVILQDTMIRKMQAAGVNSNYFDIQFDLSDNTKYISSISYDDKIIKYSVCSLIIKGTSQQKEFCVNAGVGKSTGMGFGCVLPK